ncbi:MAG: hypothetical protein Q3971_03200 [Moraxella sp.]|nr:hypothetical protein [Moraxella sp.]
MSKKISYWDIKSKHSDKVIGFGAEILKDDKYEWTLETYPGKQKQICLRLIFQNWELNNNPEIINFCLNKKLAKELIKSLKRQLREIKHKKKHSKKRGKSKK